MAFRILICSCTQKLKSFRYGKRTNALVCSQGTFSSWRLASVEDYEEYVYEHHSNPLSMVSTLHYWILPILLLGGVDYYSKFSHPRRTNLNGHPVTQGTNDDFRSIGGPTLQKRQETELLVEVNF